MAVICSMTVEMHSAYDLLEDVMHVHRALARRHGPQFRALERRIEALPKASTDAGFIESHYLGDGRFMVTLGPVVTEILRDARRLGVGG